MRIFINTTEDLIGLIEGLAQKARSEIGTTRTKLESNELKGQVYAYNEVIFYIKEYAKTQREKEDESAMEMESVAGRSVSSLSGSDAAGLGSATKVAKPV
jgi:hypothetical protein